MIDLRIEEIHLSNFGDDVDNITKYLKLNSNCILFFYKISYCCFKNLNENLRRAEFLLLLKFVHKFLFNL